MSEQNARLLLVEDEEILADILEDALVSEGYQVTLAEDGLRAWELLERGGCFDTILLDREMPRMDGIELLKRLKQDRRFESIPVIMETSSGDEESVREGLQEGAYYYLTKPFQPELLLSIVSAALQQQREMVQMQRSVEQAEKPFAYLRQGVFHFRTIEEAKMLAQFFAKACPHPQKSIIGLQELLINAVEHGNLAISYQEKTHFVLESTLTDEIERRLGLPEYAERQVEVEIERSEERVQFTIRDQGEGFDWEKYLEFDPSRLFDPHGRGIAMSKQMSFDTLEYRGNGNTVVVSITR
ncbi:response regulator [Ectothiorhodospiraceae bacterium BW-2]|nr:response regulator [Ectothiorhodospiraceae bacterium BW-2]